jgi:hypothetical protein
MCTPHVRSLTGAGRTPYLLPEKEMETILAASAFNRATNPPKKID